MRIFSTLVCALMLFTWNFKANAQVIGDGNLGGGAFSGTIPIDFNVPIKGSIKVPGNQQNIIYDLKITGPGSISGKGLIHRWLSVWVTSLDFNLNGLVKGHLSYSFDPTVPSGSAAGAVTITVSGTVKVYLTTQTKVKRRRRGRVIVVNASHNVTGKVKASASASFSASFTCDQNGMFKASVNLGKVQLSATLVDFNAQTQPILPIGQLFPNISAAIRKMIIAHFKPKIIAKVNSLLSTHLNKAEVITDKVNDKIEAIINGLTGRIGIPACFPNSTGSGGDDEGPETEEEGHDGGGGIGRPDSGNGGNPGDSCRSNSDCRSGKCFGSGNFGTCG